MNLPGQPLTKRDLEKLQSSWITTELAQQAMLRRVNSTEGATIAGRKDRANYAGIIFPYVWPGEKQPREYSLRRDKPDLEQQTDGSTKEKGKYLCPPGRGNMLYIAPGTSPDALNDINLSVIITEGEKKTLSLHRLSLYEVEKNKSRFLPIGLPGVWNWRGTIGKTSGPDGERQDIKGVIPDFDRIAWDGREVFILFDSNVHTNAAVRAARSQLGLELKRRRAIVYYVTLPQIPGINGVDDLLAAQGPDSVIDLIHNAQIADIKIPDGFRVTDSGVYAIDHTGDREDIWICSWLVVQASTRSYQGEDWGQLLVFKDKDGVEHKWLMPMSMLAGEGSEYREQLLRMGLRIAPGRKARELLTTYIQTANPDQRVRCVSKVGWHGSNLYVLPDETFTGDKHEAVLFQSATGAKNHLGKAGTIDDWRNNVARYCAGNSALVFAVSCAFAGPVMWLASEGGGGFHFRGKSSTGKTTALLAAGSVWGGGGRHGYVQTWRTTANGLEAIAEYHNHALLCLDELGQCDSREAGEIAYALANGQGKLRMTRSISNRKKLEWELIFLSSGETSLTDHIMLTGRQTRGGQEVRLCDLDSDLGAQMGIFETIHGFDTPSEFAKHISEASKTYYGTPIRAFLSRLVKIRNEAEENVKKMRVHFIRKYVPAAAAGEVYRVASRFAMVAAAGELARDVTGWGKGDCLEAAARMFKVWIAGRGSSGSRDTEAAINQVRAFLETHGSSRFRDLDCRDEDRIINRAGFRRVNESDGETVYLILPEVFRNEVCKGYDYRAVAKAMVDRTLMVGSTESRALTAKETVPEMGRIRVFVVRSKIFDFE